jgi:hypothetical protein
MSAPRLLIGLLAIGVLTLSTAGEAQRRGGGRYMTQIPVATAADFDGAFHFCRVWYRSGRGDGGGWGVDFPQADANLSIRLSDLTKTPVSFDQAREPNHLVIRLTDDALFQCPFIMMTEVGALYLDEEESERLREYLLKGGFLWADDFWGSYAWSIFESAMRQVLPSGQYPFVELPPDHAIFKTQFIVKKVAQIPSINFWRGTGGGTSEAGPDSQTPTARAILGPDGRVMVLATHNTDYGDSWEREGDDPEYFYTFAVDGYALGINVVLYSMIN